jgi:hypothetical protein
MAAETMAINLRDETEGLLDCLVRGDAYASVHLARLIEADTAGALRPFADVLAARLCDHLSRYAELGITDPYIALEDEVYKLIQVGAMDWDRIPRTGRPGEEV